MLVVIHGNKRGHSEFLRFELKGTSSLGKQYYTRDFGGILRTREKGVTAHSLYLEEEAYVLSFAHSIYDWTRRPGSWVVVSIVAPYDSIIENPTEVLEQVMDLYLEHYMDKESYQIKRVSEDKTIFTPFINSITPQVRKDAKLHLARPGSERGLVWCENGEELTGYMKDPLRPEYHGYGTILFISTEYRGKDLNVDHLNILSCSPSPNVWKVKFEVRSEYEQSIIEDLRFKVSVNNVQVPDYYDISGLYGEDVIEVEFEGNEYWSTPEGGISMRVDDLVQGIASKEKIWKFNVKPKLFDISLRLSLPKGVDLDRGSLRISQPGARPDMMDKKGTKWVIRNVDLNNPQTSVTIQHERLFHKEVVKLGKGDEKRELPVNLSHKFKPLPPPPPSSPNGGKKKLRWIIGFLIIVTIILALLLLWVSLGDRKPEPIIDPPQNTTQGETSPKDNSSTSGNTNPKDRAVRDSLTQERLVKLQELGETSNFSKDELDGLEIKLEVALDTLKEIIKDSSIFKFKSCHLLQYSDRSYQNNLDTTRCVFNNKEWEKVEYKGVSSGHVLWVRLNNLLEIVDVIKRYSSDEASGAEIEGLWYKYKLNDDQNEQLKRIASQK